MWDSLPIILNSPAMFYVFAFCDLDSGVPYLVFRKILKSWVTLIFQVKVRHPCTNDDGFAMKTIEPMLG